MRLVALSILLASATAPNFAFAVGPRYGVRCVVTTLQTMDGAGEKDSLAGLLTCNPPANDLINVKTKSSLKASMLIASKQSNLEMVLDLAGSAKESTVEITSIYLP
jgi:hypothetical protein